MSVAVCLACGGFKSNAFAQCPECGARPVGLEALAQQLLATDSFSTTPSARVRELSEKVKLARATRQPLLFEPEALSAAREAVKKLPPKQLWDEQEAAAAFTGQRGQVDKYIAGLVRQPLLCNVGRPLPQAQRGQWVAVDSWDEALRLATRPSRAARLSGVVTPLFDSCRAKGGAELVRYQTAMARAAPFSQHLIARAEPGSVESRFVGLVTKMVQLDLVSSLMLLGYADSVDTRDATQALLVYSDGRFLAGWADDGETIQVY